jgi:hypothetical protein
MTAVILTPIAVLLATATSYVLCWVRPGWLRHRRMRRAAHDAIKDIERRD